MNNKIRNYLGVFLMGFLAVLAYSVFVYVDSYSKSIQPSSFRSFSVSGEGEVIAVPDVAEFSFGLITQGGKNIADLQKENTNKMNKIINFIKDNKIDAKDIKTQSYSLEPRYQDYNCPRNDFVLGNTKPCPPPEIIGYTINQNVTVKIRDFNKIGDVLAGVVQNGANTVSQLFFTIDDPAKVENQAREEAIAKAKTKALSIARSGGFRLGRLLSVNENNFGIPRYYAAKGLMSMEISDDLSAPIIEPGSQEVKISINLVYEIK